MRVTDEQIRSMASVIGLSIPDDEIPAIAIRLGALLECMDRIEAELGSRMDQVDPLPPVYPATPRANL